MATVFEACTGAANAFLHHMEVYCDSSSLGRVSLEASPGFRLLFCLHIKMLLQINAAGQGNIVIWSNFVL